MRQRNKKPTKKQLLKRNKLFERSSVAFRDLLKRRQNEMKIQLNRLAQTEIEEIVSRWEADLEVHLRMNNDVDGLGGRDVQRLVDHIGYLEHVIESKKESA